MTSLVSNRLCEKMQPQSLPLLDQLHIPFDVICAIIEWLDVSSLKSVALLNWECNHPARIRLFRSLKIFTTTDPDPLQLIREACAFIANARITTRVENLTIDVRKGLGTSEEAKHVVLAQLLDACGRMSRVTSLSILLPPALRAAHVLDRPCVIRALSTTAFPVLQKFSINATNLEGLDQFWADHPTLNTLRILDPLPFDISGLSSPLPQRLPLLSCVELNSESQSRVIEGCSITDFHLRKLNSNYPTQLVSNLATSKTTISRFTYGNVRATTTDFDPCSSAAPTGLYTQILPQLSQLQFLCIFDSIPAYVRCNARRELALNALGSLEKLEEFEWRGNISPPVQAAFLDTCSSKCKSLKRVLFEYQAEGSSHVEVTNYSRKETEDAWVQF